MAMLLVVIALAVAAVLALSFLRSQGPTMAVAGNIDKHARARAIAESGLAFATAYVRDNPDWRSTYAHGLWLADVPYDGGTFSVYGTDDDGDLGDDPAEELVLGVVGSYRGVSHRASVRVRAAVAPFSFEAGTVVADGTRQAVTLQGSYTRPVVVCSPQVVGNTEPFVVRVDAVSGGSFEVWLQRCDDGAVVADTVHYMVMEEGVYDIDGMVCEARRYESSVTDHNPSWAGVSRSYGNSYTSPVVFGQVMTARDADWSVFWSRGGNTGSAATRTKLFIGKHVGEDPDQTRATETLGYIVIESGRHTVNGVAVDVRLSSTSVEGVTNGNGFDANYHASFDTTPQVVVATQSGMNGNNGSRAMLWGASAVTTAGARVIVDEDLLGDPERSHTAEQVGVVAFERPPDAMAEQVVVQYEFDQQELTPRALAHWRLDEPAGGGGGLAAYDQFKTSGYARVDSYDSTRGVYGPANNAESAAVSTNSTAANKLHIDGHTRVEGNAYIGVGGDPATVVEVDNFSYLTGQTYTATAPAVLPGLTPPGDLPATLGDIDQGGNMTIPLNLDLRFNNLTLREDLVVQIIGHVRVWVSGNLRMYGNSRIEIAPGSSLTLWVGNTVEVYDNARLNDDSTATGRLTVMLYNNGKRFRMSSDARGAGTVYTRGQFRLDNNAVFFGRALAGDDVLLNANTRFHADIALPTLGIATTPAVDELLANDGRYRGDAAGGAAKPASLLTAGTAAAFDGTGDSIEVPHNDAYLLADGAVSLWFNADTLAGEQALFTKDANGFGDGGHLSLFLDGSRLTAQVQSDNATHQVRSASLTAGRWYHALFSFGAEGMALYLDGVLVDTYAYGGGLGITSGGLGNREPILIGAGTDNSAAGSIAPTTDYFRGTIDDVRLYDTGCDATQAAAIMAGGDPATRLSETLVLDTGNYGAPLHLAIDQPGNVTWDAGTLRFDAAATARSLVDAAKVRTAINNSGEFSLVLRFQRADPATTAGPSVILAMASSIASANALVGQDDDGYQARARTTLTGSSGTLNPAYESEDTLDNDEEFVHLAVTYDGTTLRTYLDGRLDKSQPLSGALSAWSAAMPLAVGNLPGGGRAWLGAIDSARVYDHALSTSQVTNLSQGAPLNALNQGSFRVIWDEPD